MTQQQIKRQNRKKIANLTLIGLMAVLLVLGIFATIGSKGFASAVFDPNASFNVFADVEGVDLGESTSYPSQKQIGSYTNVTGYSVETAPSDLLSSYSNTHYFDGWYVINGRTNGEMNLGSLPTSTDGKVYGVNLIAVFKARAQLPATPTAPEGKQFAGWYYDTAFTQPYQEGDVITSDTSLYAKFVDKNYTVTYVLNGASYSSAQVVHGAKTENVAITVGTGKEFSGWYTDAACTQAYNFDTAVTADVTLYGKIQTIMCTVTFYVGSEVLTTLSVPYGSTLVAYAASASAEADVAQAILNVYNLGNFDTAAAIEEDTEVTATLNEGLLKWNNFGLWFMNNWKWLSACAGLAIVIIVGAVLTKKRR